MSAKPASRRKTSRPTIPEQAPVVGMSAAEAALRREAEMEQILSIITPTVQDRWVGLVSRDWTLDQVKTALLTTSFAPLYELMSLFETMEDSWPRLGKNLHEVKNAVAKLEYEVFPATEKGAKPTPQAEERRAFCEQILWGMRGDFTRNIKNAEGMFYDILDAYGKGLSVLEPQWLKAADGTYRLLGTRWLRPCHFDIPYLSEEEEMLKLSVSGLRNDLVAFPNHRFLISSYSSRSAAIAPHSALLRKLAPYWVFQNFGTDWLLQFAQLFGIPIRWGSYKENQKGSLPVILEALRKMGSAGYAAFPEGVSLNTVEAKSQGTKIPQQVVVDECNLNADLLVLGQTLTSEPGPNGNRSLGEVHKGIRADIITGCADLVCNVVSQQLFPAILWWNYGDTNDCPRLGVPKTDDEEEKVKAERDKILFIDMGLPVAESYLYERHGVPPPKPTDALFNKPARQPASQQNEEGAGDDEEGGRDEVSLEAVSAETRKALTFVAGSIPPGTMMPVKRIKVTDIAARCIPAELEKARATASRLPDNRTAVQELYKEAGRVHVVIAGERAFGAEAMVALAERTGQDFQVACIDAADVVQTLAKAASFQAKLPPDVAEALRELPPEVRAHYLSRLEATGVDVMAAAYDFGRHGPSSGKGGQWKPRVVAEAQARVRDILETRPVFGSDGRGRRRLIDFSIPDNSAEWASVAIDTSHDIIMEAAARMKYANVLRLETLHTTQRTVDAEKLLEMLENGCGAKEEKVPKMPVAVRLKGRTWIYDGHHRLVCASLLGKESMLARLVNLDDESLLAT